ncbi:E3 ubiquitin-protein ligase RNF14 [Aplysia californica]|uniref:RBR-type E3 ubiquitin transferase n=1 Tax=Aplysia californica TaxID=6500 RepID=A0ABM0K7C9_APLCA|nr:E3 ubiquitin-protein ligase RNF14 [Aplysia californica]
MASKDNLEKTFKDGEYEDNLQDQRDEILALQSIFNTEDHEKLKVLSEVSEENDGLYTLLITICPRPNDEEIQVDVTVAVKQDEDGEVMGAAAAALAPNPPNIPVQLNRTVSGRQWQGSVVVKYLTPLYLYVTFPPTYPSLDCPDFHLACDWLSSEQIRSLGQMLESLWVESGGMPVVFTWIDGLENDTLNHLDITNHLVLHPAVASEGEENECGDGHAYDEDELGGVVATLIRYNREQMDIEFCQASHECHVCYDEKPGTQFFRMADCAHHFCHECMMTFCEMHVRDGTVEELRCPDTECDALVPPYIVQAVLSPEAYMRWEQLLLQKTLDAMSDTVYCPRCGSLVIAEGEEAQFLAHCTVCYFSFCTQCNRVWHQGQRCETDEEVFEREQNRDPNNMNEKERKRFDKILRRMEKMMAAKRVMKETTKKCPSCKIPVEKMGGCNKMTCKCSCIFCWICGKKIEGYSHFRSSTCVLFPGLEGPPMGAGIVRRPPDAVIQMQARLELNPELRNNRCSCPVCKQQNLKGNDKNNHMKCWNCKSNFCFYCKQKIVGQISAHFMGGCPHHS